MNKIIKSTDVEGGTVYGRYYKMVKESNMNPIFTEEKPYTYLGNIKSDTLVHGWHFVFNDKFYVATYNQFHGCSSRVSVYNSDKKANFDCVKPIEEYVMYCDIETVADIFCAKVLREEVAPSAIE
jgi:hypothetical protein